MSGKPPENEVNPSKRSSPIQAYCTVDPQYLERDGEELICHKCSRRLINAEKTTPEQRVKLAKAGKLVCGFASSLALASCSTNDKLVQEPPEQTKQGARVEDKSGKEEKEKEPASFGLWRDADGRMLVGSVAIQRQEISEVDEQELQKAQENVFGSMRLLPDEELPIPPGTIMPTMGENPSDYPQAKPALNKKGFVLSPYGGHEVDVSRIPADGGLVIDPKFPVEKKKFFRLP